MPKKKKPGLRNVQNWTQYVRRSLNDADVKRLVRLALHFQNSPLGQNPLYKKKFLEGIERRTSGVRRYSGARAISRSIIVDTALKNVGAPRMVKAGEWPALVRATSGFLRMSLESEKALERIKKRHGVKKFEDLPLEAQEWVMYWDVRFIEPCEERIEKLVGEKNTERILREMDNLRRVMADMV